MTHPRTRLDDILLHPVRFSILALLHHVDWADFSVVRDEVGVSDSLLSKQLSALADAGYVEVQKMIVGRHTNTRLKLTAGGRKAFSGHLAGLRAIVATQPTGRSTAAGPGDRAEI